MNTPQTFTDLKSISSYVSSTLVDDLLRFPVVFKPALQIQNADCGTDVLFLVARAKKGPPQALGDSIVAKLDDSRFSVSHGYLNFYDETSLPWICTKEVAPIAAEDVPSVFGVVASDFAALPVSSFSNVRLNCLMLFHVWLALRHRSEVSIVQGESLISVNAENFFSVSSDILANGMISAADTLVMQLIDSQYVYLHTSPAGIQKTLYKKFVTQDHTAPLRLGFSSLERIFFNAATVPWSNEAVIRKIVASPESLQSALWYLSSPLQGSEFDQTVIHSQENANIRWWMKTLIQRGRTLNLSSFLQAPRDLPRSPKDSEFIYSDQIF